MKKIISLLLAMVMFTLSPAVLGIGSESAAFSAGTEAQASEIPTLKFEYNSSESTSTSKVIDIYLNGADKGITNFTLSCSIPSGISNVSYTSGLFNSDDNTSIKTSFNTSRYTFGLSTTTDLTVSSNEKLFSIVYTLNEDNDSDWKLDLKTVYYYSDSIKYSYSSHTLNCEGDVNLPASATATPNPTEAPNSTLEPDETFEPTASPNPDESFEPTASPNPDESFEPTASPNPDETFEPTASPNPDESFEPTASPNPTETPKLTFKYNSDSSTDTHKVYDVYLSGINEFSNLEMEIFNPAGKYEFSLSNVMEGIEKTPTCKYYNSCTQNIAIDNSHRISISKDTKIMSVEVDLPESSPSDFSLTLVNMSIDNFGFDRVQTYGIIRMPEISLSFGEIKSNNSGNPAWGITARYTPGNTVFSKLIWSVSYENEGFKEKLTSVELPEITGDISVTAGIILTAASADIFDYAYTNAFLQ